MNIPSMDSGKGFIKIICSTIFSSRHSIRVFACVWAAGMTLLSPARVQAEKILSAAETLNVDPTTGTANLNIPVDVLPGRGGLQPNINILYNSGSPNGKMGMGWILELGNIRRSAKHGVPQYTSADSFVLTQAGSAQELIYDAAADAYQPEIEGGFLKIVKSGDAWTVTDKQGTKYFFGRTSASRQDDPANSARVFQWCLDRVEDPHGNYMDVSYIKDQGQIYPDAIAYTGNAQGMAPFASVKFVYDMARPDKTAHYHSAFKVVTAKRLSAIEVKAGAALMGKYQFTYALDPETKTSILAGTQRTAGDGITSLPAATFIYSQGNTDLTAVHAVTNYPPDNLNNGSLTRFMDFNADGYTDMVRSPSDGWHYWVYINNKNWDFNSFTQTTNEPPKQMNADMEIADLNGDGYPDILYGQTGNYQVWINNKANDFNPPLGSPGNPDVPLSNPNIIVIDMNADGFPDLARSYPGSYLIYLNNGAGQFQPPASASNPPPQDLGSGNVRFADFNGDGLVDIIYGSHPVFRLHINNGNAGFDSAATLSGFDLTGLSISSSHVGLADMNGDGLTDILRSGNAGEPYYIYFNEGDLTFAPPIAAVNPPARGLSQSMWMDMNADGLLDIVVGRAEEGVKNISLNNGMDGFHPAVNISSFPNADLEDNGNMLVDMNADGLPDLFRGVLKEGYKIYAHPSAQAATSRTCALIKSDNGMGVTTDIEYENLPVPPLAGSRYKLASSPALFNTVKRTVRRIGAAESYATAYESKNGRWNFARREFRGFGEVKVTDPAGNFTRTIYDQGDIFKGRVREQTHHDASGGAMLAKTVNTWDHQVLPSGAKFAFLKRADQFSYDGNPQGRCRAEEYFYEEPKQRGNLTRTVLLGDVGVTGDERALETAYVNNDSLHILGLPSQIIAKDNLGNITRKTWFDYDGQANGTAPAAGLLTRKKEWAGDGPQDTAPETRYVYDGMGNLKSALDAMQKQTAVTYDQNYNMFPVATQNALNHIAASGYYGVDNVPMDNGLWGQLKTTTDPNNRQGLRTYDAFGRLTAGVSPLDTLALPTSTAGYEINQAGQFYKVTAAQRQVSGQSGVIEEKQFYDGLGRLMQSKTKSGTPGQFIVRGQVEYNSRGLPFKQYLPYFTAVALDTPNVLDPSKPRTTIEYDSLGRVIKTTNPDGTYATAAYGDMVTTMVDENGHQQKSYFDAYGRMIKKEEYKGADGRSPYYAAVPYSLYATTQYAYDSEGNLTKTIDAHGNVTTMTYDKLGRKVAMDDPDMGVWTYKYDLNGNLIEQTDAKGQTLRFTYDALNRLVNKTDGGALNVTYTYDDVSAADSKGRLTKAQYPGGEADFKYDAVGREIESIKKINGTGYGVRRDYDALNNLIDITYPDNTKIFYKYNPAGQVEAIANDPALLIGPQSWNLSADQTDQLVKKFETRMFFLSIPSPLWGGIGRGYKLNTAIYLPPPLAPPTRGGELLKKMYRTTTHSKFQRTQNINVINLRHSGFVLRISDLTGWLERNILGIREAEAATTDLITLEAENMTTKTTGGATTGGWNIWSNGYIQSAVTFPRTANYQFEIVAKGKYAGGAWPNMELRINQVKVWNTAVNSASWTSFKAEINVAAGSRNVAVAFTNDYYKPPEDRNLYVDKIIIREITPAAPPAAPVLNPPVAGNGQVSLTWSAVTGAVGYKIYSGTASGVYGTPVNAGNVTSSTVTGLSNGTKYYFAVTAYDASQESAKSNEQSATPVAPPPTIPPAAPVLNPPVTGDGQVSLTWSAVTGATGYKIKYGTTSGGGTSAGTDYTKDPDCVAAWKLEESAGAFVDSCGVNSGTVSGTLSRGVAGHDGRAVEFFGYSSGNNALINFGSNAAADKLGARTFTAWINPQTLGEGGRGVIINKNYQDGWVFRLAAGNNLAFSQAFSGGVVTWTTTTNAVRLNAWQHVAVTYAGSGVSAVPKIYLNGVEQALSGWTPYGSIDNDAAYDIRMGIMTTVQEFDGLIDETAIFKRILTTAQINEIMSGGLSGSAAGGTTYENVIDAGNAAGFTITGLANGTTYYFAVTAYNAAGESPLSNEVSAAPALAPVADDPQVFVRHAEYNEHGQVTRLEYGNGVVTTYTYDPLNLRLTRIYTLDANRYPLQDLNYTYDSGGNVLSITDNVNSADQTFQYDELNRLVRANGQAYGLKTYAYDEIGNIKQKDGRLYFYGENGVGPHAVSSLSNGTTFTYDANGNMLTRQGPDLITTGYAYDGENRLVKVTRAGVTVAQYTYDGDGGRTAKTAYDAANALGTCFLAGTPVLMADGTVRPIEEIRAGDKVVSLDERHGDQAVSTVTETFRRETRDYLLINGALKVTAEHPFYARGEWREAGTLKVGDKLLNLSLNEVEVKSIQKIHSPKPVPVYNIEVNKYHNYFVTRGRTDVEGYLVHNKFPGETANAVFAGTTHFVGSLFERNAVRTTKHIYLGGTRVASITNGKTLYFHGDHLGGTNVLTDAAGAVKELTEYEPFGTYARHEKFGLADEVAHFYFTGQRTDDESGLMFYGARYYDPDVGRFITPDTVVPNSGSSAGFNRYSYVYNNPVNLVDNDGHFPWLAAIIGAAVGGASAGIQSYQETGKVNFASIAMGAAIGGLSGAALSPATTAASLQITAFPKTSMFLLKSSALMTLGSQVAGAAGLNDVSSYMGMGAQYMGYAFLGLHVGTGIANWIHDPRFQNVRVNGNGPANAYQSGDNGYVNGVLTPLDKAIEQAKDAGASMLSFNPTSSPIADLTESLFSKAFFTGSIERQISASLTGLTNITLQGFSQGGIIASNVALNLGLRNQRQVLSQLKVGSTQISQIRLAVSGAMGGGLKFGDKTLVYGSANLFDFSGALGPDLRLGNFVGGMTGLSILPIGIANHKYPY